MKITAHSIVKNEQNWIWHSLNSVLSFVDEIIVWDTGSTDNTIKIIKTISSPKIKFLHSTHIDPDALTTIRQEMLEATKSDWLLILDGDEIWPEASIRQTISFINKSANPYEYLIHPYYNLVGDVFHYQDKSAGRYKIDEYSGHITIRFVNLKLLPKLHFSKPHGQQGLFDDANTLIQDRKPFRGHFLDLPYLHATHLIRSSHDGGVMKRSFKRKFDLGIPFSRDFIYPKPFYLPHPHIIPSPWKPRSPGYLLATLIQSPFKLVKRKLFHSSTNGY
ncbi:MAG: family 2 glycosyl transferase [Microgenomates group bacterium Gr01-1014_16]|nr:MAG: family 2 glycosyl transferase [Microgenomates group bacterium Gr01-1014_16]